VTPMRVKIRGIRNLYVLNVYHADSRIAIVSRRVSRKPFTQLAAGDVVRAARKTLRVIAVQSRVETKDNAVEHILDVFTGTAVTNVVAMPLGDDSVVAEFLRYHVLVRRYDGDPDAWLAQLDEGEGDGGDVRFVRWIRSRLRQDPALMTSIRAMVDATPFWRAAEA
jgi:hypothetical protein